MKASGESPSLEPGFVFDNDVRLPFDPEPGEKDNTRSWFALSAVVVVVALL